MRFSHLSSILLLITLPLLSLALPAMATDSLQSESGSLLSSTPPHQLGKRDEIEDLAQEAEDLETDITRVFGQMDHSKRWTAEYAALDSQLRALESRLEIVNARIWQLHREWQKEQDEEKKKKEQESNKDDDKGKGGGKDGGNDGGSDSGSDDSGSGSGSDDDE